MNPAGERPGGGWLRLGAWLSLVAAAIHLACIVGGGDWYRFFGAGEPIARAAERGSVIPALMATGIATVLAVWGLYALSGAGRIRRLPLLRTGLVVITAIYLARGLVGFAPQYMSRPDLTPAFMIWSSSIVLFYGVVHLVGTWLAWPSLSQRTV